MSTTEESGWSEWAAELHAGELRVRAGFRRPSLEVVAGGPLDVQFFVEATQPIVVAVASDRTRLRPDFFHFSAHLDGVEIDDPFGSYASLGGPGSVVPVQPGSPWRQWLIVNQFLRLERAMEVVAAGAVGRLRLRGGRPLPMTTDTAEAFRRGGVPEIDVTETILLRRDDARLASFIDQLIDEVRHGPPERREWPLVLLLSLRAPAAVERWRALVDHADPVVGERVRQALRLKN